MVEQKSDFECLAKLNNSIYAQTGADREKFATLLNIAYETPKGREVMNAVAFKGYSFTYDTMFGVNGACDYDRKVVRLDSYFMQKDLAPVLIHECTHIRQIDRLVEKTGQPDVTGFIAGLSAYDFIKLNRALEADACAHQAAFAYQMREKYPQVFEKEMKTPMMQAYVAQMDKTGDETKAMQASFEAWYGYKNYQEAYEKQYLAQIQENIRQRGSRQVSSISNGQISGLCLLNGKSYIPPSFFDRVENMAVSEKGKDILSQTGDQSVSRLPVRNRQSNTLPPVVLKVMRSIQGR